MKRKIFIGSSSEGLRHIAEVRRCLSGVGDLECVPWTGVFDATSAIIESLERAMSTFTGAILVATPDDVAKLHGHWTTIPRENVMLEFGLMAARLGRSNVAICHFGEAELPSDLTGVELIQMIKKRSSESANNVRESSEQQLRSWVSRLLATAESIPRTEVTHGYTGTWEFDLTLGNWRGIQIDSPSLAIFEGHIHLLIPTMGDRGTGIAEGRLTFELVSNTKLGRYSGEYRIMHKISNVICEKKGGLTFESALFSAQLITHKGLKPSELKALGEIPEDLRFAWNLEPVPNHARTLSGSFQSSIGGPSIGKVVRAFKLQ